MDSVLGEQLPGIQPGKAECIHVASERNQLYERVAEVETIKPFVRDSVWPKPWKVMRILKGGEGKLNVPEKRNVDWVLTLCQAFTMVFDTCWVILYSKHTAGVARLLPPLSKSTWGLSQDLNSGLRINRSFSPKGERRWKYRTFSEESVGRQADDLTCFY